MAPGVPAGGLRHRHPAAAGTRPDGREGHSPLTAPAGPRSAHAILVERGAQPTAVFADAPSLASYSRFHGCHHATTACVGSKRAILATAHKLLRTICSILWDDHPYKGSKGELRKCCVGTQRRRVVREAAFDASGTCASILRDERETALQRTGSDPPAVEQDPQLEQNLKDLLASDLASLTLGQLLASARSIDGVRCSLRQMGVSVPEADLQHVVDSLVDELGLLNTRTLEPDCLVVFMDDKHIEVRSGKRLVQAAIHTAVGIEMQGRKQILSRQVREGAETLEHRKEVDRGLRRALLCVQDAFTGLAGVTAGMFP